MDRIPGAWWMLLYTRVNVEGFRRGHVAIAPLPTHHPKTHTCRFMDPAWQHHRVSQPVVPVLPHCRPVRGPPAAFSSNRAARVRSGWVDSHHHPHKGGGGPCCPPNATGGSAAGAATRMAAARVYKPQGSAAGAPAPVEAAAREYTGAPTPYLCKSLIRFPHYQVHVARQINRSSSHTSSCM